MGNTRILTWRGRGGSDWGREETDRFRTHAIGQLPVPVPIPFALRYMLKVVAEAGWAIGMTWPVLCVEAPLASRVDAHFGIEA